MSAEVLVETQHQDIVHDTQFDYYGRLLATCSSDRTIRVFSVTPATTVTDTPSHQLVAVLTGHEGPVWMVAWAHPKFGCALASAGYDGKVIVWKGDATGASPWKPSNVVTAHSAASVNAVAWAPHEAGCVIASAGSDGHVFLTAAEGPVWSEPVALGRSASSTAPIHPMGAMGVSFAPIQARGECPVLATGGCDGSVKIWQATGPVLTHAAAGGAGGPLAQWRLIHVFNDHRDWVRDVACSPDAASPYVTVASCSQDKSVVIRRQLRSVLAGNDAAGGAWEVSAPATFADIVFRLSWNPAGNALLVTTGDSSVFILTAGATFADAWLRSPVAGVNNDLK